MGGGAFAAMVTAPFSAAIQDVIDKMFDELQSTINSNVYGAGTSMATGTLVDAWRHEAHGLWGTLQFDPSMLPVAPESWVHGSQYDPRFPDVRAMILDIIQGGYRAYNAKSGMPIGARPFWEEYVAKVNANFDGWMRAALIAQGLPVV
jgi:hypothetical protein